MFPIFKRFLLWSEDHTYTYLLIALVVLLVVAPFFYDIAFVSDIEQYLVIVVVLAALYNIARDKRHLVVGLVLGLPAITSQLVSAQEDQLSSLGHTLVFGSSALFFCYLIWRILDDVLRGRRMTAEKITGSICAYLLIGMVFATLYYYLESANPDSIQVSPYIAELVNEDPTETPMAAYTYFSFVTLTTLGYGDISPITNEARTFAWVEAMIGQLFLAIMIARLVGMHIAEAGSKDPPG